MPTSTPPHAASPTTPVTARAAELADLATALAGQYDVMREIGRGGMGIVYLGRDIRLDREVAIKTLPAHLAEDPVVRERFLREARTAAALFHRNIVPIHRADELGGRVFFVMGFVDGESMAQRLRARGPFAPLDLVRALRDVADALAYAHSRGVVHRDIKAENILLERGTDRAMVTDFGIARLAEAAPLTATGQVLGTVYYLSPEQVSGDAIDARSDIYALGVLAYVALSGRFPFDADLASAVLVAHVTRTPSPLHEVAPHVPRELADIVDRCLSKAPEDRYARCEDLLDALQRLMPDLEREAASAPPTPSSVGAPLVSDTEAREILARAADLQAMTGIEPRPLPEIGERDVVRDRTRTSGHRPDALRDAAVEAGINARYVDHALIEHGLRQPQRDANTAFPEAAVSNRSAPPNPFVGAPMRLDFEVVVDGEMPVEDFDLVLELIRQTEVDAGELTTVGRSFSWQNHPNKGNLHVSVLPRNGRTTIRVCDSLAPAAGGFFGGIMGGGSGMGVPVWLGVAINMHDPIFGVLMWAGTVAFTYISARTFFGVHSRSRERKLRALAERIASQARESIDYAARKLPPARG